MSDSEPSGPGLGFAERQLRRLGWRRGQGLGKRQDGIAEAIRVKVKCDTAGVGHDPAEPFSFHWWDHVFNQAAANIAVEDGKDGVSMKTLSEQQVGVSTRKPRRMGTGATMVYGRFVKSATLTAAGEEPTKVPPSSESSEEEEDEEQLDLSSARRLSDEELLRLCGGRTAHKGARHGLTMVAKLARLEEQERTFLATWGQQRALERSPPAQGEGKKRKRGARGEAGAAPEGIQNQEPRGEEQEGELRRRRRKKQQPSEEEEGEEEKVQRKKKKKEEEEDREELVETERKRRKKKQEEDREELVEMKRKRRKKQKEEGREELVEMKMKRRKKKQEEDREELVEMKMKRRKKKQEEDREELVERKRKKRKRQKEGSREELVETERTKKRKKEDEELEVAEEPPEDTEGEGQAGHSPKRRKKRKREKE